MVSMALNEDWDLDLDGQGNLSTVDNEERLAQDVSTACLVWRGEGFWDTNFGVPYQNVLGQQPPLSSVSAYLSKTAQTVEGVEAVSVDLKKANNARKVTGTITINGETNVNI